MTPIASVKLSTGRWYLDVCGVAVAMETDPCRDPNLRGTRWNRESLDAAAEKINAAFLALSDPPREVTA